MDHFITSVHIEKICHLSGIEIKVSPDNRTHLLLTGKNGSGKTTVLRAIKQYLQAINDGRLDSVNINYPRWIREAEQQIKVAKNSTEKYKAQEEANKWKQARKKYYQGVYVHFNTLDGIEGLYQKGKFLTAFYPADRKIGISRQKQVEDVELNTSYSLDSKPGDVLLKYLVHLKTQQSYARNESDSTTVQMLDGWFKRFEDALKVLLDNRSVKLYYDYRNYNFEIIEDGRNPFGFDQLSDGYSAVIQIVADIILRMEQNWLKKGKLSSYNEEGIVLIDELETHLHVNLQRTILPFLTKFFPNIQFIVSTHSPYILNSIENCVVYDLENRIRMEDMSGYPAEGIVEGYFGVESYSDHLLEKIKRYEELVYLKDPTEEEEIERVKILVEMKQLSGDLAKEAKDAFQEIENRRMKNDKI